MVDLNGRTWSIPDHKNHIAYIAMEVLPSHDSTFDSLFGLWDAWHLATLDLRKAVGQCEDELCRQCGVANFSELKLGPGNMNFGSFLSQNVPWWEHELHNFWPLTSLTLLFFDASCSNSKLNQWRATWSNASVESGCWSGVSAGTSFQQRAWREPERNWLGHLLRPSQGANGWGSQENGATNRVSQPFSLW